MESLSMSNLLTPAAQDWVENTIQRHSKGIFGKLESAIIWTDVRGSDGELVVPIDPIKHVFEINKNPWVLLNGHDPGKPIGQMLESANFESEDGRKFIVAVLGYYAGGEVLNFRSCLDFDEETLVLSPESLPILPETCWIEIATDPREVSASWLDLVTRNAPLSVKRTELSHNAADYFHELIKICLPYATIVFVPFITSISSEAGKDTYVMLRKWVKNLLAKQTELRDPIVEIQAFQNDCEVSFLFRGTDVGQHYAAHDALPNAAARAAQLITKLKATGMTADQLTYEFDGKALKWFPSFAILKDKRIITNNLELIAIEQLPKNLSLGLKITN